MSVAVHVLGKPRYDRKEGQERPYNERVKPTSETYVVVISKLGENSLDHNLVRIEIAEFEDIEKARRCASAIRVALATEG